MQDRPPRGADVADLLHQAVAKVMGAQPSEMPDIVASLASLTTLVTSRLLEMVPRGQSERLLTMKDAAERLGVAEETARELGRRGDLPIVQIGRSRRVRESAIERFVETRERGGQRPSTYRTLEALPSRVKPRPGT
jgi:excisionase family DNA binding protein